MKEEVIAKLCEIVGEQNLKLDEPMSNHTTFRIGGPAQVYITPESVKQVQEVIALCRAVNEPYYIIGNGSNLLVSDDGVQGVIIQIYSNMSNVDIEGENVTAEAGVSLARLSMLTARQGLGGLEFASGIPGSLGGAVYMNAGAYGGEMKDVVTEITVLDCDGQIYTITNPEAEFGYRTSRIAKDGLVVLQVKLKLVQAVAEDVLSRIEELSSQRRLKQPLEYPSAGSTFKRPEGHFAGKLIADAKLKGYSVGGASVSTKHAGFVVNMGGATAKDVCELTDYVAKRVYELYGVGLELEIQKLGF